MFLLNPNQINELNFKLRILKLFIIYKDLVLKYFQLEKQLVLNVRFVTMAFDVMLLVVLGWGHYPLLSFCVSQPGVEGESEEEGRLQGSLGLWL